MQSCNHPLGSDMYASAILFEQKCSMTKTLVFRSRARARARVFLLESCELCIRDPPSSNTFRKFQKITCCGSRGLFSCRYTLPNTEIPHDDTEQKEGSLCLLCNSNRDYGYLAGELARSFHPSRYLTPRPRRLPFP